MSTKAELETQVSELQTKIDGLQSELDTLKEAKSSTLDVETLQKVIQYHRQKGEQLRFQERLYAEQNRKAGQDNSRQRAEDEEKMVFALETAIRQ